MSRLHAVTPKPSPFLAVICLAIVHRLHPEWVAVPLVEACVKHDLSAQRLSRLCSRAIALFDGVLGKLTQRGRPKADLYNNDLEVAQLRVLLGVATTLLRAIPLRGNKIRALLVGAWLRVQEKLPSITCRQYCETLGISERAFRRWRNETSPDFDVAQDIVEPQSDKSKPKPRPRRRGRFDFDVTLPGTQVAADTTDLNVFGVKLKLIGSQDVGGRDQSLFENVIVDTTENAELVEEVFAQTLNDLAGAQAITDQGTPYLAEVTRTALEAMEIEHAPQREGDPLGKATIERAFGTVKTIAAPLFALTIRLAKKFPSLRETAFAKAFARLVLTFLLRAYQAGARAARRAEQQRQSIDAETLSNLAAESRDKARAELRSKRMLLEHIHHVFGMNRSRTRFVRQFRTRPLKVIEQARDDFAKQAHRHDIRDRTAYFGKLVSNHLDVFNKQRSKTRQQWARAKQRETDEQAKLERDRIWMEHPDRWLLDALKTIAAFWLPEQGTLVGGGAGPGKAWIHGSLGRLTELHGTQGAIDIAQGAADIFARASVNEIGDQGVCAVLKVLFVELGRISNSCNSEKVAERFVSAILARDGPS